MDSIRNSSDVSYKKMETKILYELVKMVLISCLPHNALQCSFDSIRVAKKIYIKDKKVNDNGADHSDHLVLP